MIKRFYKDAMSISMIRSDDQGDWCKYSDVEQLQKERDEFAEELVLLRDTCDLQHKLMVSAEQRAENKFEQERDELRQALTTANQATVTLAKHNAELAARVERLERASIMASSGFYDPDDYERFVQFNSRVFAESPSTSFQAHDKALLLRLADELSNRRVPSDYGALVWLRTKAEELDNG